MQTSFSPEQLADPAIAEADAILRKCVHCGFCIATCPTYLLLGDERDSPRGRIYLMKDMLENARQPSETMVRHIDRCLSCLSCMTTCPSGVHYMHLVDQGRAYVEARHRRPAGERRLRALLAWLIPHPGRFRLALMAAALVRPFRPVIEPLMGRRMRAMLRLAPVLPSGPSAVDRPQVFPAEGERRARVALLSGCAGPALAPAINEATIRLLTRHGCEVVIARGAGCCGSLVHHLGRDEESRAQAAANVRAWWAETVEGGGQGLDAIVVNASGCGTTLKDYGHMLARDGGLAEKAKVIAGLARDVTEVVRNLGLKPSVRPTGQVITYHSACSMQHGQNLKTQPQALLKSAGFEVKEVPEGHICCGSAGVYNILQPDLAERLKARKVANIARTRPEVIATGNLGCIVQLRDAVAAPVVHTVELLDWATGGPRPSGTNLTFASLSPQPERQTSNS